MSYGNLQIISSAGSSTKPTPPGPTPAQVPKPPNPTFVAGRAYRSAALALPATTLTKIPLDTITAGDDPSNMMDITTNHRCNIAVAGAYLVTCNIGMTVGANSIVYVYLYHNGAQVSLSGAVPPGNGDTAIICHVDIVRCQPNDYLEMFGFASTNANLTSIPGLTNYMAVAQVA